MQPEMLSWLLHNHSHLKFHTGHRVNNLHSQLFLRKFSVKLVQRCIKKLTGWGLITATYLPDCYEKHSSDEDSPNPNQEPYLHKNMPYHIKPMFHDTCSSNKFTFIPDSSKFGIASAFSAFAKSQRASTKVFKKNATMTYELSLSVPLEYIQFLLVCNRLGVLRLFCRMH